VSPTSKPPLHVVSFFSIARRVWRQPHRLGFRRQALLCLESQGQAQAGGEWVLSSPCEIFTKGTGLDAPLPFGQQCDRAPGKRSKPRVPAGASKSYRPILFDSLQQWRLVVLIQSTTKPVNQDRQLRRIRFFTDLFCYRTPLLICRLRRHKRGLHFCHEPSYLGVKTVAEQYCSFTHLGVLLTIFLRFHLTYYFRVRSRGPHAS
jgi:hypothetical protein